MISRVKIMAHRTIAERHLPQDGRTSTNPAVHRESGVIRGRDRDQVGARLTTVAATPRTHAPLN